MGWSRDRMPNSDVHRLHVLAVGGGKMTSMLKVLALATMFVCGLILIDQVATRTIVWAKILAWLFN